MIESGLTFGLPLLTKDLIEQAARRRTYVLRVIYAAVLYGAALWVYGNISGSGARIGLSNLGQGGELFKMLIRIQFYAIIVLLPALSCGAITTEKERDTLGLLLLTKLSPLVIILEKLLSRLVTLGTYQLLSLPLFAIVYGMGGVELFEIIISIWFLAFFSAAVGAWSIVCSAWYRTTSGAFIAAYSVMPLAGAAAAGNVEFLLIHFKQAEQSPLISSAIRLGTFLLIHSAYLFAFTAAAISVAQRHLLARAFVPPRNLLLELFKKLDRYFEELNQQTTKGIILVRDYDLGPVFEPIAWRETQKKSLGTVRYLFRLLVVLEVPLILAIGFAITDLQHHSFNGPTTFFLAILWPIAAVTITVHTTNVLASERSRQTLDVLLATPLSPTDIVTQKLAGVRRLIGILFVPFATMVIFQSIWTLYVVRGLDLFASGSKEGTVFIHEILGMSLGMIVYPRLLQWSSFHLALRLKNQTHAVLMSLGIVIGISTIPLLMKNLLEHFGIQFDFRDGMEWLSPVRVLFHRGFVGSTRGVFGRNLNNSADEQFLWLTCHAMICVAAWFVLRQWGLWSFSRVVERAEPKEYRP